jgi:predicted transcriptional regulator YdeE
VNSWPPQSGYQAADAPGLERYDEKFNPETGLGGFEIWIPVWKQTQKIPLAMRLDSQN